MIPVDMRKGRDDGDCLMAALASILECDLDELPEITRSREDQWIEIFKAAAWRRGFKVLECSNEPRIAPPGYAIAIGFSPHDTGMRTFTHACVALDGHIVHDPNRTRDGVRHIDWWFLLVPLARSPQLIAPSQNGAELTL